MSDEPASWLPDPTGKHDHRYWDGTQWTDNVADAGVASTDPYEPIPSSAVSPDAPTAVTPVPADDTAAYPSAGPPPPYVPPSPVAGASGGSKRGLVVGGAILAVVVLAVIAFLALDSDDDEPTEPLADRSTSTTDAPPTTEDQGEGEDEPTDGFGDGGAGDDGAGDFFEGIGLSEEQVECLTDRIEERVESGELEEEQMMSEVFSYLAECDISMEDLIGPVED